MIKWQGYIGKNHSWSTVARSISTELIRAGYSVDLISTNGTEFIPDDLKPYLKGKPSSEDYSVQLTYTAMKNFPMFLKHGTKNRFGIWCYEFAGKNALPTGFAKNYKYTDLILAPSNFSKQIFIDSGVPDQHIKVIPHGADIPCTEPYPLKTKKKVKILANIAQPHLRKNITGLLKCFGMAFTKRDDVVLVLKTTLARPAMSFDIDIQKDLSSFYKHYPEHAELELITEFIPQISSLYKACDVTFTMSHCEAYWVPGLEALVAGNVVVAPRYGGQLDFLNDDNSILIGGKIVPAPARALYYEAKPSTYWFEPDLNDAVDRLRFAVANLSALKARVAGISTERYSWCSVTDQIMKLVT